MTRVALAALAASLLAPFALSAQGAPAGRCELEFEEVASSRITATRTPSGQYNSFIGGGLVAHCANQDVTLRADSAESYGDRNVLYLIGSVHYTEPRVKVNSRRMTYYRGDERLLAEGDVDATLPSGTTMRGPTADYYREIVNVRPRARLIAPGRPTILLVQHDTVSKKNEPLRVVANTVVMDGDSLVYASGRVEIDRTDMSARGDSAAMDSGREFARLMRTPSIEGKTERKFRLTGRTIDLYSKQRQLQRVIALDSAHAVSEDLDLRSDTVDMRVDSNRLQRAYAWGKSRAHVVSPERDIVADSIDVYMPNQVIREVRAVRGAFAQTVPDTLKIRSGERDWLRGDVIVARFDTLAPTDTSKRPRVHDLVAQGSASSFYQIPSHTGDVAQPAVNYVRGREITVTFNQQQVSTVRVVDQAAGVYLEPATDSTAKSGAGAARGRAATQSRGGGRRRP